MRVRSAHVELDGEDMRKRGREIEKERDRDN